MRPITSIINPNQQGYFPSYQTLSRLFENSVVRAILKLDRSAILGQLVRSPIRGYLSASGHVFVVESSLSRLRQDLLLRIFKELGRFLRVSLPETCGFPWDESRLWATGKQGRKTVHSDGKYRVQDGRLRHWSKCTELRWELGICNVCARTASSVMFCFSKHFAPARSAGVLLWHLEILASPLTCVDWERWSDFVRRGNTHSHETGIANPKKSYYLSKFLPVLPEKNKALLRSRAVGQDQRIIEN